MTGFRIAIGGLFGAALIAGSVADVPAPRMTRTAGEYHVLAADFHVHSFPFSWSTLSPWDTVLEARHQGLDLIAMTPHNHVWVGAAGRWFARLIDGPIVLGGEEIASNAYHLIAVGITETIDSQQPAARAIDEIHRQGGVAIAAHPYAPSWPAYDAEALGVLDGAEIVRPDSQYDETLAAELRVFFARAPLMAIGASDYHGLGVMGYSRTLVFARARTEAAALEALRAKRTVVYDRGRVYGDAALVALAAQQGTLDPGVPIVPAPGALRWFSRIAGLLALTAGMLVRGRLCATT